MITATSEGGFNNDRTTWTQAESAAKHREGRGRRAAFKAGDDVKIAMRFPIGHFRVPNYIRSKHGNVGAVIEPRAINNEDEGFGRNGRNRIFI